MEVNYNDERCIDIIVDENKNIVIFPSSESKIPFTKADGSVQYGVYLVAYHPIELFFPYTNEELAEKIKYGIEQWGIHECYTDKYKTGTFEEKYYSVKGFKKAIRGKRYFDLGWNYIQKKYVSFSLPWKSSYSYIGIDTKQLSDNADWLDYANTVIEYINCDC